MAVGLPGPPLFKVPIPSLTEKHDRGLFRLKPILLGSQGLPPELRELERRHGRLD